MPGDANCGEAAHRGANWGGAGHASAIRDACVRAAGIIARRGERTLLAGIDLEAAPGEIVGVVGPNGSGKSTLLEILALLRRPDGGDLHLFGRPARFGDVALRRRVTLAMQPALLLHRSVLDNVRYGLRARGIARGDATRRAREVLEVTGAGALAGRSTLGLSAGERQRVNLARALALPVDLLLLDEPTANLDETGARAVVGLLGDLRANRARAIVLATPGEPALLALCDRTLRLEPTPATGA